MNRLDSHDDSFLFLRNKGTSSGGGEKKEGQGSNACHFFLLGVVIIQFVIIIGVCIALGPFGHKTCELMMDHPNVHTTDSPTLHANINHHANINSNCTSEKPLNTTLKGKLKSGLYNQTRN